MRDYLADSFLWVAQHWWIVLIYVLGIAATFMRVFESSVIGAGYAERKQETKRRALADKISTYAREVHLRYPTGDVVVSIPDLAYKVRRPAEDVASALNLLLEEQKVQKTPVRGYWRLHV